MSEASAAALSNREDFEPFVGRTFRFGDQAFALTLVRIDVGPPAPPFRQPFSLVFRGPSPGPVLAEGLYEVEIEHGPTCALHVMPIHTPLADRQDYQSVFC